jgi:ABC-2 type transport system ATP-binding protein
MMDVIVEAAGLRKRFGTVQALDGLTMSAAAGQVVAVLGPNGAGKTTLVRTLATLSRPDSGTVRVAGIDVTAHPEQARTIIGLAGQHAAVEEAMTGHENLAMIGRLYGLNRTDSRRRADRVLEQLGLTGAGGRLVRGWSGGMRRRLDLGASLVGQPRLLLLDEPTTGLDPASRIALWDAVRDLVAAGTDVLLTTQYLEEADQLASQIVIVDHGRVVATGTPSQLKSQAGRDVIEVHARDPQDIPTIAGLLESITRNCPNVDADSGRVSVAAGSGITGLGDVVDAVRHANLDVADLALRRPTLDEVFLALTGESNQRSAA